MKINEKNLIAYSITRDHIDKEGYLLKRGEVNKTFQRRWFVLKGNLLFYFEKKGDKEPLGVVILEGCTVELAESDEYYVFKLTFFGPNLRTYELSAESQEELESWMKCLSRASYDYLKLVVADLQKQLEDIEENENPSCIQSFIPPVTVCGLPTTYSKQRENPFNKNEEISYSELWRGSESLENVSALLMKSSYTSKSGSINVNPSLPLNIPFRPAPPPPIIDPPSFALNNRSNRKSFLVLHKEYGESVLKDRLSYTNNFFKSCQSSVDIFSAETSDALENYSSSCNLIEL
ncbi:UNVERIFIED_CONTAM: hypothetical protein RMT77_002143 [Armadillidium vulgare]|nr:Sesquipedalian-1 [Armadillidium vulgare]